MVIKDVRHASRHNELHVHIFTTLADLSSITPLDGATKISIAIQRRCTSILDRPRSQSASLDLNADDPSHHPVDL